MRSAATRGPRFPPPPLPHDAAALSRAAVEAALAEGFVAAGVVAAAEPASFGIYARWIEGGYHGEMRWLERDFDARRRYDAILPHARSVLAVARSVPGRGDGNVAKYARGEDYHRVVRRHLRNVADRIRPLAPNGSRFRVCVDTAPLLERDVAVRAGLGGIGKSGLLIVPGVGSNVVLGELLTDVALAPTAAPREAEADLCRSCTACLDSCPTRAFLAPRLLDARKCLSYLTIEKRGPLTVDEEAALGGRLFGCDVCQDVCPWNAADDPAGEARGPAASIAPEDAAKLSEEAFRLAFFDTAIWRATRSGLVRNAEAALRREDPA
ncbi:MAG TPA: tRNA epoxyqueuosine(34) reductase QueG [Thermoanaerobaculia bacterium]|nr:tRNA epoxyqueuosine(34) reductase QueG [Thermoanaerobaculia bacterium]